MKNFSFINTRLFDIADKGLRFAFFPSVNAYDIRFHGDRL